MNKCVFYKVLLLSGVLALISHCALPDMESFTEDMESAVRTPTATAQPSSAEPIEINTRDEKITLAWDAPTGSIDTYRIYYREHLTPPWEELDEIPSASTEYEIQHSSNPAGLGNGSWDFGVSAVSDGEESGIHDSLQPTASPTSGWYVIWDK